MSNQVRAANGHAADVADSAGGTVSGGAAVSGGGTADGIGGAAAAGHGGRPTMKDVAFRAGVALKTVSRVVNGEPSVTPETARRVLGAIQDLGFRRNESARLLRTGRTATLGFIADSWADLDHAAVYRGLEEIAREHGYLLYSGSTDHDPDREERLTLAMTARRVDGLVISPAPGPHDYLNSEIRAGVATVFVLRPPDPARARPGHAENGLADTVLADTGLAGTGLTDTGLAGTGLTDTGLTDTGLGDTVLADTVLPDERAGALAAVRHLVGRGHRRIGFLGDFDGYRSRTLRAGYVEAMTAAGLAVDPAWATLDADRLAEPDAPVTAVLCADPSWTRAALRAGAHGVTIVAFGDLDLADLVSPPVTVVSYDPVLIGRTAGERLIQRMSGDQAPPRLVNVPVRLITRD
jgi:LacI family transcriptional regulator